MRVSFLFPLILLVGSAAVAQDTNFATGPQYLMNYGTPLFAHSIATPSLSWSAPTLQIGATAATAGLSVGAQYQTLISRSDAAEPSIDLFHTYYGAATAQNPPQNIEIGFRGNSLPREELPASIRDAGVSELTTPQILRGRGYGLMLGEAARQSKINLRRAPRVYTNADIDRLHGH